MISGGFSVATSANNPSIDKRFINADDSDNTTISVSNQSTTRTRISSSSWFNPVATVQSLIYYSLFMVVVSQLICPVLLPLVLSSFVEKQTMDKQSDHFIVSFSVGFENDKRLVTNMNLSATKLITILQWLIHFPLVVLPYVSLLVNKSYVRESRMIVYWFCILSLFLSNVIVSLKQASFDWISFIPNILESTDISWGGEKLILNRSIPLIRKNLETSSILPQLLSLLLFSTITLYFIRDIIFGLNVNFRGRDEIVGIKEFVEREFSTCLISPLQAMLKLTSIDSSLETNITTVQPAKSSQKELTQNVPSNKDIQSPTSPTDMNVTPSVETGDSPRIALSISNTSAQPTSSKKQALLDAFKDEDEDDDDWSENKFSKVKDKKEKMVSKSDKKTESDKSSHSPSPTSDLPSVSMVITNAAASSPTEPHKPHSILSKTSPTVATGPKIIGGNFMNKRYSNRTPLDTPGQEIVNRIEAVANKNRNSKALNDPIEEEKIEMEKHGDERRKVAFDD